MTTKEYAKEIMENVEDVCFVVEFTEGVQNETPKIMVVWCGIEFGYFMDEREEIYFELYKKDLVTEILDADCSMADFYGVMMGRLKIPENYKIKEIHRRR